MLPRTFEMLKNHPDFDVRTIQFQHLSKAAKIEARNGNLNNLAEIYAGEDFWVGLVGARKPEGKKYTAEGSLSIRGEGINGIKAEVPAYQTPLIAERHQRKYPEVEFEPHYIAVHPSGHVVLITENKEDALQRFNRRQIFKIKARRLQINP